jgi:hypothetical protein
MAKGIHQILSEVTDDREIPTEASGDHVTCFVFERIVRKQDRITTVGPELEHLQDARPDDTRFAWERMGDPVRCTVSGGSQITMWPWLDLATNQERVELYILHLRDGRKFRVTPMVRAHYRDRIKTGSFHR